MMARRQYKNPPIEEAVCEIRFAAGPEWDLTFPSRFYESIKDQYPGKPRQQALMEAQLQAAPRVENPMFQLRQESAKLLFPDADERRLVGIGPNVLSVHVLRPYTGWEDFRSRIEEAYVAYRKAADPKAVTRIAVRYINRIVIEGTSAELDDYFTVSPQLPPTLALSMAVFLNRVESVFDDEPIRLTTTFGSADAPDQNLAFLLDLDVTRDWSPGILPLQELLSQIDELRRRERDAFEATITNRTREVFDAT